MPFVLKHKESSQLYTCTMVNGYKLEYYGTKYWDYEDDALSGIRPFLESRQTEDPDSWELLELTENQLKMCNVKLKNDPRLSLYWDEATKSTRVSTSP